MTPERVARGRYVYLLTGCDNCHSQRDWSRFAGPVVPSGRGQGSKFPPELKLPGEVAAPNITSDPETGIGAWSDGEKIRAIRDGIGRDGRALFPLMPYRRFRHMSDDDVASLVAYLNTLAPRRHRVPPAQLNLLTRLRIKGEPRPAGSVKAPDPADRVSYGGYLSTLAGCGACHTPSPREEPSRRLPFGGGRRFTVHGTSVVSTNITADAGTGIGRWSEQDFLDRIYVYREWAERGAPKVGPENFTVMPWLSYAELQPEDLRAIYAYLRAQKPVYQPIQPRP
jgi:cytochrome c553